MSRRASSRLNLVLNSGLNSLNSVGRSLVCLRGQALKPRKLNTNSTSCINTGPAIGVTPAITSLLQPRCLLIQLARAPTVPASIAASDVDHGRRRQAQRSDDDPVHQPAMVVDREPLAVFDVDDDVGDHHGPRDANECQAGPLGQSSRDGCRIRLILYL